jgi:hypothetical protein
MQGYVPRRPPSAERLRLHGRFCPIRNQAFHKSVNSAIQSDFDRMALL